MLYIRLKVLYKKWKKLKKLIILDEKLIRIYYFSYICIKFYLIYKKKKNINCIYEVYLLIICKM